MNMNQSRAVGQPRGNPGPRTPLPSPNVVDERQLTYKVSCNLFHIARHSVPDSLVFFLRHPKPSRGPWVQLLFAPSDGPFVKGQSVQIYDIVPMYRTPSAVRCRR